MENKPVGANTSSHPEESINSWRNVVESAEEQIRTQAEENEYLRSKIRVMEWHIQNGPAPPSASGVRSVSHGSGPRESIDLPAAPMPSQASRQVRGSSSYNGGPLAAPVVTAEFRTQQSNVEIPSMLQTASGKVSQASEGQQQFLYPEPSPPMTPRSLGRQYVPGGMSLLDPRAEQLHAQAAAGSVPAGEGPWASSRNDSSHLLQHQMQDLGLEGGRRYWLESELHMRDRQVAALYSKEAQLMSQLRMLERKLSELRLAFDEQQRSMVDATAKALSYRQQVMEENVQLTQAFESVEQERSLFVSYLLPLLAEFGLHPPPNEPQQIVEALKMVFKHLMSAISLERRFPLGPRPHPDPHLVNALDMGGVNGSGTSSALYQYHSQEGSETPQQTRAPPTPAHRGTSTISLGPKPPTPRHEFSKHHHQQHHQQQQQSEQTEAGDVLLPRSTSRQQKQQGQGQGQGQGHGQGQGQGPGMYVTTVTSSSQTSSAEEASVAVAAAAVAAGQPRPAAPSAPSRIPWTEVVRTVQTAEEASASQPTPNATPGRVKSSNGASSMFNDSRSYPSGRQADSRAAEEEEEFAKPRNGFQGGSQPEEAVPPTPLKPAIEGLRIVGDASLGSKLTACGHSINGTALCIFQWVRIVDKGERELIEGAASPEYTISADDCGCVVAIECVPMDDQNNRGDIVSVAANDGNMIAPNTVMQDRLKTYLEEGTVSFEAQLLMDENGEEYYDSRESTCVLIIKRSGFSLRKNSKKILRASFTQYYGVFIILAYSTAMLLVLEDNRRYFLDMGDSRSRDTAVLAMRQFKESYDRGNVGKRKNGWLFN